MVHVIWAGIKEFEAALTAIQAKQLAASRTALSKSLSLIEREAKANLSLSTHTRYEPTNSMPGEPPALVSGDLRRSVKQDRIEQIGPTRFSGQVGPTIEYGRIQELGGEAGRGAILPSRPYLQPAFENALPEIAAIFREEWAWALRG